MSAPATIPSDRSDTIAHEPTTARSHTLRGVRLPAHTCPGKDASAMRDCTHQGHIRIEGEKACLSCEYVIQAGDYVAHSIAKRCPTCSAYHPVSAPHQGEMLAVGDTADPREWGGKG